MDQTTKQLLTSVLTIFIYPVAIYIEYLIVKRLIKYGINYFYEKKSDYNESNEYCKMELTREELDEISLALKSRIEDITQKRDEAHSAEAKDVLSRMLWTCIAAQKQTTYAGQPEEYQYQGDR